MLTAAGRRRELELVPARAPIGAKLFGLNDRQLGAAEFAVQPACHQFGFQRIEFGAADALQAVGPAGGRQHKLHRAPTARANADLIGLSHAKPA